MAFSKPVFPIALKPKLTILPPEFYQQTDVASIALSLIGKVLVSEVDGQRVEGIIVETEAYHGENDRACHAYLKKRTPRTETMFLPGGYAYVYLCYGIHQLFNIVTNRKDEPDAVLIRAVEPLLGIETMLVRRKMAKANYKLCQGPGCVAQAFGINKMLNSCDLTKGNSLWVEDRSIPISDDQILATTRVGVEYAKEDALRLWRFLVKDNFWVSARPKTLS